MPPRGAGPRRRGSPIRYGGVAGGVTVARPDREAGSRGAAGSAGSGDEGDAPHGREGVVPHPRAGAGAALESGAGAGGNGRRRMGAVEAAGGRRPVGCRLPASPSPALPGPPRAPGLGPADGPVEGVLSPHVVREPTAVSRDGPSPAVDRKS